MGSEAVREMERESTSGWETEGSARAELPCFEDDEDGWEACTAEMSHYRIRTYLVKDEK